MAKIKIDSWDGKEYPIYYSNGNIAYTKFESESYAYTHSLHVCSTYSAKDPHHVLLITELTNEKDSYKRRIVDVALDLDDVIKLRDALNHFINDKASGKID